MSHCNQCGLDWTPRVNHPRACPKCKRYDWNQLKRRDNRVTTADRSNRPVTLQTQSREDGRVLRAKRTPSTAGGDASAVLRNEGDSQGRPDTEGNRGDSNGTEKVQVVRSRSKGVSGQGDGKQPKVGVQGVSRQEAPERLSSDTGAQSFTETELTEDDLKPEPPRRLCKACEGALSVKDGHYYCPDLLGCSLGGQRQGKAS